MHDLSTPIEIRINHHVYQMDIYIKTIKANCNPIVWNDNKHINLYLCEVWFW